MMTRCPYSTQQPVCVCVVFCSRIKPPTDSRQLITWSFSSAVASDCWLGQPPPTGKEHWWRWVMFVRTDRTVGAPSYDVISLSLNAIQQNLSRKKLHDEFNISLARCQSSGVVVLVIHLYNKVTQKLIAPIILHLLRGTGQSGFNF